MVIVRGTTPTFVLTFTDVDLTEAVVHFVTIKQVTREVTLFDEDLDVTATTITFSLTQNQTLAFEEGKAEMQADWVYADDTRGHSDIKPVTIDKNLYPREVRASE